MSVTQSTFVNNNLLVNRASVLAALGYVPENVVNKSTDVTLGTSDILYPSQKAVKDYVDATAAGESNTASNVGTGEGTVFKQKTGVDLELKTIKAGTNVTIDNNADDITINGPSSAGEANTASNVGAEKEVFKQKTGVDLEFRTLKEGTNITITQNASDLEISAGSESYNPEEPYFYANLRSWLAPDGIVNNTTLAITSWNDKSHRSNALTTVSSVFSEIGLRSYKSAEYNSTSDHIMGSTTTTACRFYFGVGATGNYTWFGVFSFTGSSGTLENQYSDSSGNGIVAIQVNSTNLRWLLRDDGGSQSVTVDVPLTEFSSITICVWKYDNSTGRLDVWVNGTNYNATNASLDMSTNVTDEATIRRLGLGGFAATGNTFTAGSGMTGKIHERILYVDAKSSTDINAIANYLATKYGLTWTSI